jgi:GTP pyrophosphokinase
MCCNPVYGDEIVGYLTRGRGVSAHRDTCRNLRNVDPDRLVEVAWGHMAGTFPTRLRVEGSDRIGLIHDLCGVIRDERMNLHKMASGEDIGKGSTRIDFTVYTSGLEQLARLFDRLEAVRGVSSVMRIH